MSQSHREISQRFFAAVVGLLVSVSFITEIRSQNLTLDTSFNAGVSDTPPLNYVSAVQPDGKILVGGEYDGVNGAQRKNLVRLSSDGSIDATFNAGGIGPNANVHEIIVLGDGKILIGGGFTTYNGTSAARLARLNADGTLDTTFSPGGAGVAALSGGGARVTSIAIQADGKLLIGGQNLSGYNEVVSKEIFRLNADGSLDDTFLSGYTNYAGVEQVAVLPDGKIVIVADVPGTYNGVQVNQMLRLNPNGTLNLSFELAQGGFYQAIFALAVQPNGKIVVGGSFDNFNGIARNGLARYNTDGTIDAGFVPPNTATGSYFETVSIRPDGKILACGSFDYADGFRRPLVRFNSDGSLDSTFSAGKTDAPAYHFAEQTNGKLVVTGSFSELSTGGNHPGIARLNGDGSVDNSFTASFVKTYGEVMATAQQSDGKILVGGVFITANGNNAHDVARFNADGTLDNTFSTGLGAGYQDFFTFRGVRAIAVQTDGKILIGGAFQGFGGAAQTRNLARLNSDGSVDSTFTLSSSVLFFSVGLAIEDLAVLPDGKILICGVGMALSPSTAKFLLRLNSDGSVDSGFNSNGLGSILSSSSGYRITLQPDGKIIVGGVYRLFSSPSSFKTLVRFNADGTRDTSFAPPADFFSNETLDLALQSDGKIVYGNRFSMARVNPNGTSDGGFTAAVGNIRSVLLQPDEKILVGGPFVTVGGRRYFARLTADGALDPSVTSGFNDAAGYVNTLALQPDGKLLIGGVFSNYYGVARSNFVRLTAAAPPSQTPTNEATNTPDATPTMTPSPTSTCTPEGLYDNGPFLTSEGLPSFSSLQTTLGLKAYGFSAAATDRIADDFTVPSGSSRLNTLTLYGYQTNSGTTSTFNAARVQIWNGPPNLQGSSVVFGDLTTNRFASTSFTGVYRIADIVGTSTRRPIMRVVANLGVTLPAGTYWIDFQLGGTGTAGPYVPPVTISGQVNKPGSNGLQFTNSWIPLKDIGPAAAVQDVPFIFNETCVAVTPTNTATATATGTVTNTATATRTATATPTPLAVVSGTITYGNAIGAPTPRPVSNITVSGTGPSNIFTTTIFPSGDYSLSGFLSGTYVVTPTKTGGVNGVTSFDAAKIAQHVAAVATLTGSQLVVADVSGNGTLSSFDAGQIARYVAALSGFGLTSNWVFLPVNRTYNSITTDIPGQDYSALLMGEVSGNWANSGARSEKTVASRQTAEAGSLESDITVAVSDLAITGEKEIIVPVNVKGVADRGIISFEFDLRFDPSVIQPLAEPVDIVGTVSRGLSFVANGLEPGLLRVVVYGAIPIDSDGVLLNLKFTAVGPSGSKSPLIWERIMFNEGERRVAATDGLIEISR